ncbi:hypothetical protein ACFL5Z_08605 [Planctomycetota bacterium]
MKHLRLLSMVLTILYLASLSGCAKKEDESPAERSTDTKLNNQAPTEGTNENLEEGSTVKSNPEGVLLKDVLALWETDRKDDVVTQFQLIQWDDPSVFHQMQDLTISEQEFRSLPQGEMKRIVEEAMNLTGRMRKLMFYVVSVGEKRAASGDTKAAKEHFMAVRRYGEALSRSERLEVIRMHGKAAIGYADKKLSGIE